MTNVASRESVTSKSTALMGRSPSVIAVGRLNPARDEWVEYTDLDWSLKFTTDMSRHIARMIDSSGMETQYSVVGGIHIAPTTWSDGRTDVYQWTS
jgi:hypothetical protein